MNRFAIEDSFRLEPNRFVLAGRVVEGRVGSGMVFEVPEAGHRWQLTVRAVEFIRKKGGTELTGLVVQDAGYLPGLGAGWTAELHEHGAQRIEPMRGSAIRLVLYSGISAALPLMAHPRHSAAR